VTSLEEECYEYGGALEYGEATVIYGIVKGFCIGEGESSVPVPVWLIVCFFGLTGAVWYTRSLVLSLVLVLFAVGLYLWIREMGMEAYLALGTSVPVLLIGIWGLMYSVRRGYGRT